MAEPTGRFRPLRFAAAVATSFVGIALSFGPAVADAGFVIGFGLPYPGFYAAPWQYYPPAYVPYPAPGYYPATPGYYPTPAAAGGDPGEPHPASAAPSGSVSITYTDRPGFANAAGQPCREYRAANGAVGTACRAADGQWRVAN